MKIFEKKRAAFLKSVNHPQRDNIKNRTGILKDTECKDCRFWMVCNGGCPLDAIMVKENINKKSAHCDWVKPFLEEYFEPVTGLVVSG